ncbi:hypothetical protein OBBRIDRAFT_129460 [Obba rivulosa]|uniref:Uncharacterized protein n=1 Tax=Obba rivulosa TaxID=1052685 RepID=A0A8E2DI63_9APHY|nr:hypothetical protein OBBRIDRAFT_129460 [Obba rivulosa]
MHGPKHAPMEDTEDESFAGARDILAARRAISTAGGTDSETSFGSVVSVRSIRRAPPQSCAWSAGPSCTAAHGPIARSSSSDVTSMHLDYGTPPAARVRGSSCGDLHLAFCLAFVIATAFEACTHGAGYAIFFPIATCRFCYGTWGRGESRRPKAGIYYADRKPEIMDLCGRGS